MKCLHYSKNDILIVKKIEQELIFQNKKILIIEGNIGCGKTTFIENFFLNQKTFGNDSEEKNKTFKKKFIYFRECYNERKLIELSEKIKNKDPDLSKYIIKYERIVLNKSLFGIRIINRKNKYGLFDRNFIGHYVFTLLYYFTGLISKYQLLEYEQQYGFNWKTKKLPFPKDKYIVLHIFQNVEHCFRNIKERNRLSDQYITETQLFLIEWCYYCFYEHYELFDKKTVFPYPITPFKKMIIERKSFEIIRKELIIPRVKERINLYAFYELTIEIFYDKKCPIPLFRH